MAARYTVAKGHEFNYPSQADDDLIQAAGGRSKMSKEDLSKIQFKTVREGEDCSDMPEDVLDLYLKRGWVTEEKTVEKVVAEKEEINNG